MSRSIMWFIYNIKSTPAPTPINVTFHRNSWLAKKEC